MASIPCTNLGTSALPSPSSIITVSDYKINGVDLGASRAVSHVSASSYSSGTFVLSSSGFMHSSSSHKVRFISAVGGVSANHAWALAVNTPEFTYRGESMPFATKGSSSLPALYSETTTITSSDSVPPTVLPGETVLLFQHTDTTSDSYNVRFYWSGSYCRYYNEASSTGGRITFSNAKNCEGIWLYIQAAGGGGGGYDVDWFGGVPGGGGGGSGAYALVYLALKRLWNNYSSSAYFAVRLGPVGAAGASSNSDGTARQGKAASNTSLLLYPSSSSSGMTLLTLGGGKGGGGPAYSETTGTGGEGGSVSFESSGEQFEDAGYFYVVSCADGSKGGIGVQLSSDASRAGEAVKAATNPDNNSLPVPALQSRRTLRINASGVVGTVTRNFGVASTTLGVAGGGGGASPCSQESLHTYLAPGRGGDGAGKSGTSGSINWTKAEATIGGPACVAVLDCVIY